MNTLFIRPDTAVQSIVSQIMVVEKEVARDTITPLPFYADGSPGIIFQRSEGGMFINDESNQVPGFFLYGQTIRPVTLLPKGSFRMIIFYLYPFSISTLFGIRSAEISDSCLDMRFLPSARLQGSIQQLFAAAALREQVDIISRYLHDQLTRYSRDAEDIIHFALAHIIGTSGMVSIAALRKQLHVTERTFERKFEHHVGVSPKLFSRIVQFQSTLQQLQRKAFNKLSDLAYQNGYADQSHFIRSFKEFTGLSPMEYMKQIKQEEEMAEA